MIYRFDTCVLDVAGRELLRGGRPVRMERQVLAVLLYLIEHRQRVVPKRELLDQLWQGTCVSESALGYSIAALRRATGDDGREQRIVRTHHRFGYRFVAQLREQAVEARGSAREHARDGDDHWAAEEAEDDRPSAPH